MPYGEAVRLVRLLCDDPTSYVSAAVNAYDRPWSFEWAMAADLYDLTHAVHADKRPKPYPRPWRTPGAKRHGRTNKTRAEVVAILNAHGHQIGG